MIDVQGYILFTLALMALTFCIMFAWLCIINKTLDLIRTDIHKMEDILWHMQRHLSAQDVDAGKCPEDGSLRESIRKRLELPTDCVKTASDDSIRKTPM